MNRVSETCPVCWREYALDLAPISAPCGHSVCAECSTNLRNCPLCRKRLQPAAQRPTNYSLLSLVERLNQQPAPETRDQEAQTERRPRRPQTTEQHVIPARQAQPVKFKLSRDSAGLVKGFEILLN